MECSEQAVSNGYMYYRHLLPLRIMHWINVVVVAILLMSGLNIFNAHPALYWGRKSYSGSPPFFELTSKTNNAGEMAGITRIFHYEFNTQRIVIFVVPQWIKSDNERR